VLNENDIEYMRQSQDEIYVLRQRPISVIYVNKTYDDITGEFIGETETERDVNAVITEISTRSKDGSRRLINGVEVEQGDLKIDIKIELIDDIKDVITRAEFDEKKYELLGGDRKGIGVRNRVEYIGREWR